MKSRRLEATEIPISVRALQKFPETNEGHGFCPVDTEITGMDP